jgi:hypothetical protein
MNKKLVVIICHFKENLKWVEKLNKPFIIYNKNPELKHMFDNNLPNIGFDTMVYLKYIIDNYENLPDYVCFSQDNPFEHCPNFIEKVNNFDFEKKFIPLGKTYYRDNEFILNQVKLHAEYIGIEYNEPIKFINSAQCIVSKDLILKRDKKIYQKIKNSIPNELISNVNYLLEYLWPSIFSFNDELEISINNCL